MGQALADPVDVVDIRTEAIKNVSSSSVGAQYHYPCHALITRYLRGIDSASHSQTGPVLLLRLASCRLRMSSLARLEGDPSCSASTLLVLSLALRRLSLAQLGADLSSRPSPDGQRVRQSPQKRHRTERP